MVFSVFWVWKFIHFDRVFHEALRHSRQCLPEKWKNVGIIILWSLRQQFWYILPISWISHAKCNLSMSYRLMFLLFPCIWYLFYANHVIIQHLFFFFSIHNWIWKNAILQGLCRKFLFYATYNWRSRRFRRLWYISHQKFSHKR